MRTRRSFRPAMELMPSRDLPSSLLFPTNPAAPIRIPTAPPVTHVDPTDPYQIPTPIPYDEPIVGPDTPPQQLDPSIDLVA